MQLCFIHFMMAQGKVDKLAEICLVRQTSFFMDCKGGRGKPQ